MITIEEAQSVLQTYRDGEAGTPLLQLADGGIVVGQHVDADNHLHYVVRGEAGGHELVDAQDARVAGRLAPHVSTTVTIPARKAT